MKKNNLIILGSSLVFILLIVCLVMPKKDPEKLTTNPKNDEALVKIEKLKEENSDKELTVNRQFGDVLIYLNFLKDGINTSYFVDYASGEVKNLEDFIKNDQLEAFQNKITELLKLKYPTFVVEAIMAENVNKEYHLEDGSLVILYDNVLLDFEEETILSLRVNFNEIKDYLTFAVELDTEYENENGYLYDKNKKTVAITFDDGPNGSRTNEILNILEANKAHATFFMVGNRMKSGSSTILNVLNHNCEIGSHSYNHTSMKRQTLNEVMADEAKTEEIYKSITGKDLLYTRPPYGAVNTEIKNSLTNFIINWNIDPEDWRYRDKDRIVEHILTHVSDGDVILLHDSYDSTVEAVREVLPKLYLKGYQVVSIGEIANLKGRTLELNTIYRSFKKS